MIERPTEAEYAPFYAGYVALVPEADVLGVLESQPAEFDAIAGALSVERETSRYAPGKWSVRQVVGHVVDAERVFGYRAFCISRGEQTALPGFDENDYVARATWAQRPLGELAREFAAVRASNLEALRPLDAEAWRRSGIANASPISVRALAFIMAGHVRHHLSVLRRRYGC